MKFQASKLTSRLPKKIKDLKKDQLVILLLAGVLLLVIAIPVNSEQDKAKKENVSGTENAVAEDAVSSLVEISSEEDSYARELEQRLKSVLEKVEGVGAVEVMITLKSSSERVVEKDTEQSSSTVEESDSSGGTRTTGEVSWSEATLYSEAADGSQSPYVIKELEPRVEGVVVIAEGGGDSLVKQDIIEAVEALFSIEAHKIKIMKMEGSK